MSTIPRSTKSELSYLQSAHLDLLTTPLFTFHEVRNAAGDLISKTKVQNLTTQERRFRTRYYRNRQIAPKGMGQRMQLMQESLAEMYKIRASEEMIEEETKQMDRIPEWRQYVLEEPDYFQ